MTERAAGELPSVFRLLAAPAGFLPVGALLTRALRDLARRRPGLFERLGEHRQRAFVVDPTDLDLFFRAVPDGAAARITVHRRCPSDGDVVIRGPILALLGLLDGTFDGDALFFNRTITVSGRTDSLLALRNAIEDAELKPSDLLGVRGALASAADAQVPRALSMLRRITGLPEGSARP